MRSKSLVARLMCAVLAPLVAFTPVFAQAQPPVVEAEIAPELAREAELQDQVVPEAERVVQDTPISPSSVPAPETDPSIEPISLPGSQSQSAVTPQAIRLPNAEGSIEGMGESFSPVLSSGTASFSVPIAVAPGRAGVQPSLALSYATSGGNGSVGIGWGLGAPFISRQTDRRLPHYIDRP